MVGSWGLSWKASRRPLERDIHTRGPRECREFPPPTLYLLLVTYRYRRSSGVRSPSVRSARSARSKFKPGPNRSTSQTRNSLFNMAICAAWARDGANVRRTGAFVLWSLSVERRFVLYRTLPASPAPHQLRLPYGNTRVVSSARGEVSLCAAVVRAGAFYPGVRAAVKAV